MNEELEKTYRAKIYETEMKYKSIENENRLLKEEIEFLRRVINFITKISELRDRY